VTTMWSKVTSAEGNEREEELRADFWKQMVEAGCRVHRFKDTYDSAWHIIGDDSERFNTAVLFQLEVANDRLRLTETHPGKTQNKKLVQPIKDRQDAAHMQKNQFVVPPNGRIVVVMGPTGAGKSTFIERATGHDGKTIGHKLRSFTSDIRTVRTTHPTAGYPVLLVDTPGFDDMDGSDMEIIIRVVEFLVKIYKGDFDLASIVYLHKISDNRMTRAVPKNLRIFTSLCGQKVMPSVALATTMWSKVTSVEGNGREEELRCDFWKEMVEAGCRIHRFKDTHDSAWHIIGDDSERSNTAVLFQSEVVNAALPLTETRARKMIDELEQTIKDGQEAARMLDKHAQTQTNQLVVNQLNERKARIEDRMIRVTHQLRQLKRRIAMFFRKK